MNSADDAMKKMLVVDDSSISRMLAVGIFDSEFVIYQATDGIEALRVLHENPDISIVITDLAMPNMDGYELMSAMSNDVELKDIPVIVMSALNAVEDEIEAFDRGASDMVTKPIEPSIIRRRVDNLLSKREAERVRLENRLLLEKQHSQLQMRALMDSLSGGIVAIKIEGDKLVSVFNNEKLEEMLGYTHEETRELFKYNVFAVVFEEERQMVMYALEKVRRGESSILECRFIKKNGDLIPIRMFSNEMRESDGTSYICCLVLDITQELESKATIESVNAELMYRVLHDVLTGVDNRDHFFDATQALFNENPDGNYSIIGWNVTGFKTLNDIFGKQRCDELLRSIAGSLMDYAKDRGTVGRLYGDKFVMCVPTEGFDPDALYEKVEKGVHVLFPKTSIRMKFGIYQCAADTSDSVQQMTDLAFFAINALANRFTIRYNYFDKSLSSKIALDNTVEREMETALKNGQFAFYLQPIYSSAGNVPIGAEALARWIHPERGVIPPGVFIPVFERNGFIDLLDRYIWRKVCEFIRERRRKRMYTPPISVNISRVSLYNAELAEEILELITEYGVKPNQIKFEVTESAYNDNSEQLISTVRKLQGYGIAVMMDDFGSGYSSFNMLRSVKVDALKVDMRFLSDLDTDPKAGSILTSIIRMTKWLNLPTIIEGVETKQQVDYLRTIGCDVMQGYYFSKPVTQEEFAKIMLGGIKESANTGTISQDDLNDLNSLFTGNPLIIKLFDAVSSSLTLCEYMGDMIDLIRANEAYYNTFGYTVEAAFLPENGVAEQVVDEDKETFMAACRKCVNDKDDVHVNVKRKNIAGKILYLECYLRYIAGGANGELICISFTDISQLVFAQQETTNVQGYLKLQENFMQTMMLTAPWGIFLYYFEGNKAILSRINDQALDMLGCSTMEEATEHINNTQYISREDLKALKAYYDGDVADDDLVEAINSYETKKGERRWTRMTRQRVMLDRKYIQTYLIDLTKQKQEEQRVALETFRKAIEQTYDEVAMYDFMEDNYVLLTKKGLPVNQSYGTLEQMKAKVLPTIDGKYHGAVLSILNSVDKLGTRSKKHSVEYRTTPEYGDRLMSASIVYVTDTICFVCKLDVTDARSLWRMGREDTYIGSTKAFSGLLQSLPEGVVVFDALNDFELLFCTPRAAEIFEIEFNDKLYESGVIEHFFAIEKDSFLKKIHQSMEQGVAFEEVHKAMTAKGKLIWCRVCFTGKRQGEQLLVYTTLTDITEDTELQHRLALQVEKFKILSDSMDLTLFDYDTEQDRLTITFKNKKGVNTETSFSNFMNNVKGRDWVYSADEKEFSEACKEALSHAHRGSITNRINLHGEGHRWVEITYVSLADERNDVYRVVGKVEDVQDQVEKQHVMQRDIQEFKKKAELDVMTNIFNRAHTEEMVGLQLRQTESGKAVFVVLDIDDFKSINDTFGHPFGDIVLKKIARILKSNCRKTDTVGRIGGEEFVIQFVEISSMDIAIKKLTRIAEQIKAIREELQCSLPISVSMGVAVNEEADTCFDDIFERADKALYEAKRRGKDTYTVYGS